VRGQECLDLLLALNAGLPGMASLHANSAREALVKMCTLPLLAGENISMLSAFRGLTTVSTVRCRRDRGGSGVAVMEPAADRPRRTQRTTGTGLRAVQRQLRRGNTPATCRGSVRGSPRRSATFDEGSIL